MAFVPASREVRMACDTLKTLIARGGEQAAAARTILDDGTLFLAYVRWQRSGGGSATEDDHPRHGGRA